MLDSIQSIDFILQNPYEPMIERLNVACLHLIKDETIKDKRKIETLDRVYSSLSESSQEINNLFHNLYTLLSKAVASNYSAICAEKADQIFQSSMRPIRPRIFLKLSDITLSDEIRSPHSDKLKRQKSSLSSSEGTPTDSPKSRAQSPKSSTEKPVSKDEFSQLVSDLEAQFSKCTITDHWMSEEMIAVHQWTQLLIKTKNIFTVQKEIHLPEKKFPRIIHVFEIRAHPESLEELKKSAENAEILLQNTVKNIGAICTSQEKLTFVQKAKETFSVLENIKKALPTDLNDSENKETEIFSILAEYAPIYESFLKAIFNKNSSKIESNDILQNALLRAHSFFEFTETHYFSLDSESKQLLFQKIELAEPFFEHLVQSELTPEFVLLSYISLLVQKQPLIIDDAGKKKNYIKIHESCHNYITRYKKSLENRKSLYKILEHNNSIKISIKGLSPRKSPTIPERKKADEALKKIIKKHTKKKEDILLLLAKKAKKYRELKEDGVATVLSNSSNTFTYLCKANLSHHNITLLDALKIAYTVEKNFFFPRLDGYKNQDLTVQNQPLIFIPVSNLLSRALLIDISKKSFVIISKLNGDLKQPIDEENTQFTYITGYLKKISAAASFIFMGEKLIQEEMIVAVPRKDMVFSEQSIKYLFEFRGKRGLMSCNYYIQYNKPIQNGYKSKQIIVQKRSSADLANFMSDYFLRDSGGWKALFSILEDVVHGLYYMHSNGYIHWDIKLGNILFFTPNEFCCHYKGMLNDFDTLFNIRVGEQPGILNPFYATINYTAPEVRKEGIDFQRLTEQQAKARDMYAVGCMFMDILNFSTPPAPRQSIYEKITAKEISENEIDSHIKLHCTEPLRNHRAFLEYMAYHLIYPNPEKRWTCLQLKKELLKFQSNLI